ncbi:hypothetical protein HG535_0F05790 [Zygotorulaspora mrakii]|uniref:Elongation factor 1 alpha-like protein n=1 Tax=Zygotorulaspora mrakii TaxID=42260 RepID=A0A7H9B675_ZYGMR|nr:uncharacterized protein HG535_0F05790 [Zygotorulaspora mrakii]QLG74067.1 hypothetical protein HG535_0F05790 [Zygotorulaspora mrakii]
MRKLLFAEYFFFINTFHSVKLETEPSTMSKLEQLARMKVAERPSHLVEKTGDDSNSTPNKGISLLSKLKKNGTSSLSTEMRQPLSLSDRLKAKRINGSNSAAPSSTARTDTANNGKGSLHDKLRAMRSKAEIKKVASKAQSKPLVNDAPRDPPTSSSLPTSWDQIRFFLSKQNFPSSVIPVSDSVLGIIEAVTVPCKQNARCKKLQKRKYGEIFSVFYPDVLVNTNKRKATSKTAAANFKKPSPDDVVINAQNKALTRVNEMVSGLKISENKHSAGEEWHDSDPETLDNDDGPPKYSYKRVSIPTKPTNPVDIQKYLETSKAHCSFVVLGHVDAGKSTLMGRLLYDVGAVDNNHIRKLKKESERIGKGSFHFAWVMDQTQEERERGVTVSICPSDFETANTQFTIVDAPGHSDFVPNAIAGISLADIALLCVDCGTDAFESGFNLDGQTKEHTILARSMGVNRIVVAMNKMDTVEWYYGRFDQIKNELSTFFKDVGFKEDQIDWVPCSGLSGEGVYKIAYPENASWYKGPTLIEKLEYVAQHISNSYHNEVIGSPFLFSILEAIPTNKNEEAIISGRVESGSIQPGETITIYPSEQSAVVSKILVGNDAKSSHIVVKGDFATLRLRHAHVEDIETGDLAGAVDYDVPVMREFSTQLLTFKMDRPILPGTSFMLFRGICQQPARVSKLVSIIEKQDPSKVIKKKVRHLGSNQAAIVEIELTERKRYIPILKIKENKRLGRILLRKDGRTIAAGAVI